MDDIDDLFDCSKNINSRLFRNIVSIKPSQDLFDDLSENKDDWHNAIELERNTHPELKESALIQRAFDYSKNQDYIGYPFENITHSRFSNGRFGLWYGSETLETSICETAYHSIKMLKETEGFAHTGNIIYLQRRVGTAACSGVSLDLTSKTKKYPWLIHPNNYKQTQLIGDKIFNEGHPLLRVKSARSNGINIVAFNQKTLSDARDFCYLDYKVDFARNKFEAFRGDDMAYSIEINNIIDAHLDMNGLYA